jgi:eukaryotic-like serine/threonine-protein kinase
VGTVVGVDTRAADRTVAGRYRLLDRLGSGGMGTVWRGEDVVLGRQVAVKEVAFPHGVSEEEREVLRERTRREARAAAKLDHPSAVTVYDVVEEDGTPYLVMELVDARTLAEVVRTDGPLTPHQAAEVGIAVIGALEAAHAQGIVHRDVKPGNVLLRPDGRVVLTDFGIATSTGDSSITSTGLLLGSPSYIAPERARGEQPGPPSDLWSLGATLFTAVEGKAPYDKGEPLPTMTAVVTGEHAPFVAAGPLAPVLDGLLEKDPDQRMTAEQACAALKGVLATAETQLVTEPYPVDAAQAAPAVRDRTAALDLGEVREEVAHKEQSPVPGARRSRTAAFVLAVTLLLIAAVGVLVATSLRDSGSGDRTGTTTTDNGKSTGTKAADIPAGWQTSSHDGWTVAVPSSYAESVFKESRQYKDPSTGRTLRVSTLAVGKTDAVADRRTQAASFASRHDDYREIAIAPADYRGYEAADWEFTYSDGGADLHALNRVFVVDGRGYSLFFQTRSTDDWSAAKGDFDRIAQLFQP